MQAHTLQPLGEVGIVSVEISMRLPDEFAISIEGAGEPGKWVHTTLTRVCFSAFKFLTRNGFLAREPILS
jgi:hypothetical protein